MRFSINKSRRQRQAYPTVYESEFRTFAAGRKLTFPTEFLNPAKNLTYAKIKCLWLRVQASDLDVGSAGGPMRLLSTMFSNVLVRTLDGYAYNLRGSSLRTLNFAFDSRYSDTADAPNLGASTSDQTREFFFPIRFDFDRFARPQDLHLSLAKLVDGGEISVTCAASALLATNSITVSGATISVVAEVYDKGLCEMEPVVSWQDWQIDQVDKYFPCNGYLAYLGYCVGEGNILAQTAWASQKFDSKNLQIFGLQDTILKRIYQDRQNDMRRQAIGISDTVVQFTAGMREDPHLTGEAYAIFGPSDKQALIDLPLFDNVHVKTTLGSINQTPIPVAIVGSVLDGRTVPGMERCYPGSSRFGDDRFTVVTADGNNPLASQVVPKIRALSPLRIVEAPAKAA